MQFEHREVTKLYHAVVEGIHQFVEKEVNKPIAKKTDGTVMIQPGGKPAQTFFSTVKAYRQHTLVACKPITGRMHQIRIHLAYLGAPIIGDIQYGAKPFYLSSIIKGYKMKKWEEEEPFLKRFGLHAAKLVFRSLSGVMLEVEATYPPDFSALIKQLEKAS